jgi:hypothetical protein
LEHFLTATTTTCYFNWPGSTSGDLTIDHPITSEFHRFLALFNPSGGFVAGSFALQGLNVPYLLAGDYYLSIESTDLPSYRLEFNNAIIPIAIPDDPTPVPTPPTLPLLVTGLGLMAWLARRRERLTAG